MKNNLARIKMSKKQRKLLDAKDRMVWTMPPVTKKIENKKKEKLRSCWKRDNDFPTAFLSA